LAWLRQHGQLQRIGVEGTGSYGAGFATVLRDAGVEVIEVDRPDRRSRRRSGKSDPLDAYAAAQAVLAGRATTIPKTNDGPVASIRALRIARRSAVKARTQTINQLRGLLVTAPAGLRETLAGMAPVLLIEACARLRPGADLRDPLAGTKAALRRLARRYQTLDSEISELDDELRQLVTDAAPPALLALHGVGIDVAATVMIAAGDNPERMRSEAAFAHLCGAAPIPASSGRTQRHRLNRGGNRDANRALHVVALTRMRHERRTRDFVARRTAEGLSSKEIIHCLKRYIAREIYYILRQPRPATAAA
jgi:transposase